MNARVTKLGGFVDLVMGQAPPGEACNKDGLGTVFVKAGEFQERIPKIREWTTEPLKFAKSGDTLVCVVGATAGKVNYSDFECAIGRSVAAVRPIEGRLDSNFLFHYLQTKTKELRDRSQGAAQGVITREMLQSLSLVLPSMSEQRRIAAILDQADALRAKRREALAQLDSLPQSIFIEMFGDLAGNPKKLLKQKLCEIAEISTGSTPSRSVETFYGGDIPWVKTTEVTGGTIQVTEEKLSKEGLKAIRGKLHPVGSIVVAMYGQGQTRGRCAMLGIEASCNQACGVIRPSRKFDPLFMFHQLRGAYAKLRALGRGGNQENLNLQLLGDFEVLLPPMESQKLFSSRMLNIDSLTHKYVSSANALDTLFYSIQHRAFRGEL